MTQTCAKLESNAVVVGIDVSKDHLDAAQSASSGSQTAKTRYS